MTTAEMNRRLATLTEDQIAHIAFKIEQGYGESGIKNETPYSRKQINAVFKKVQG